MVASAGLLPVGGAAQQTMNPRPTTWLPIAAVVAASALSAPLPAQSGDDFVPPAGMLRNPDVSSTHIVFSYSNNLWLVPRAGGTALPLTSTDGSEAMPRFSPDGKSVAFLGNYEGNADLYTIPIGGGVVQRVTHHPSTEVLSDWHANGDLLYFASGLAGLRRQSQIFMVSPEGGMPTKLPVPYGTVCSVSEDGRWLAYTSRTRDSRTWKRYRGGLAADIWLFDLHTNEARLITDWEGTDTQPMWWKGALYYLSDDGGQNRLNLWKYSPGSGSREQLTRFTDNDIKFPAVGPGFNDQGEIVFQHGSELKLYNLRSGQLKSVEVRIPGDKNYLRPRTVDASKYIQGWHISPSAKRATAQARGDIWTVPAENGVARNLTRTNGVAERSPAWSPDGRWIAYFSDASGEYEIHLTQSDGKGETRQLTSVQGVFKNWMGWSPDSKMIVYLDCGGSLWLTDIESGDTQQLDESPFGFWIGAIQAPKWSHDSRFLTYARALDDAPTTAIYIYEIETGTRRQVTSGFFGDGSPTFDRKGDYLYFTSGRVFSPTYSQVDSTFVYRDNGVLLAVPLTDEVERLWEPESDEELWDEEKDEDSEEDADEEGEEGDEEEGDEEGDGEQEPEAVDDGISGTWEGLLKGDILPPEGVDMTISLAVTAEGSVSGSVVTPMGTATITSGTYNKASGDIAVELVADDGSSLSMKGKVDGNRITGTGIMPAQGVEFTFDVERTGGGGGDQEGEDGSDKDEAKEKVEIDFAGFEARAIQLPVSAGNFGNLAVNHKNQLLYTRQGTNGGIKLFDVKDDGKSEKTVGPGGGFVLSADGKNLLTSRGSGAAIMKASAGASAKNVKTSGMSMRVQPREEWEMLFTDAWRIFRDYFYDPNMHGVDWKAVHDHYKAMIAHAGSREDITYLIGEMIGEVNVGHAYLGANGDGASSAPMVAVGMLGVDWELDQGAYRIGKIHRGADWDSDAVGPLSTPGVDVHEGDYLLAVNGVPVDVAQDPWAPFVGLANKDVQLTVSAKPVMDEESRDVVVRTLSNETNLRFRSWIERNRKYVEEQSDGQVGYIYVVNTGIPGQNDLFRQFYGQIGKKGLIIDERWNGGGQIPTRFIELLNRPATNYWATRGGKDFHWPPDSHQGAKAMLINEDAGSGGDAFPYYFRQAGIGKLIGRRTWGGLVGISGNPQLIDGGSTTVPTFAFYDREGTWAVEGHGVDPDIEVMDDPSKMVDGGDPQLDAAISHILGEIQANGYQQPGRPAYPDRSGIGVTEEDK